MGEVLKSTLADSKSTAMDSAFRKGLAILSALGQQHRGTPGGRRSTSKCNACGGTWGMRHRVRDSERAGAAGPLTGVSTCRQFLALNHSRDGLAEVAYHLHFLPKGY